MRLDTINHPILIIGLGGSGTDALLRVKAQVQRRFAVGGIIPSNIQFLSFETNAHDKKRYQGTILESHETVLLSNAGVGAILGNRSTMPSYISEWLDPELTITDGMKGASGNRQAGRLLLFEKINTAIDAIDNKIRTLRVEKENKLLVFILTGVSGGTGGGMFLDIPYIIRGLMEQYYGAKSIDRADISGYFFTPDVHIAENSLNIHSEEYIQRNGYAALKELDYWMNIEERVPERFYQRYGTRLTVNSAMPPYNLCHLVCATNIDGVYLKDAYARCMDVVAENITNFLAQEEKTDSREFAIHDYQSNLLANIAAMKSNLPPEANHSANFIYNIIGAASAALPTLNVENELLRRLFDAMDPLFDALPDLYNIKDFCLTVGLDEQNLTSDAVRRLPPMKLNYVGSTYYSYQNVIQTQRVDVDEKLNDLYLHILHMLGDGKREATAIIGSALSTLREYFTDMKYGPVFTARLLDSKVNPCLLAWLESCIKKALEKQTQAAEETEACEIAAVNAFESAQKAVFFTRERKKNEFIAAKIREYTARVKKDCAVWHESVMKTVYTVLSAENDKTYARIAWDLRDMKKSLERSHPNSISSANYIAASIDNTANANYIITASDSAAEADALIQNLGKETLIKNAMKALLSHDGTHIKEIYLNFLRHQFKTFFTRSMDDCITAERVENEIAPRLNRDALPVFHMENTAGVYQFPGYSVVSIPENAPGVLRAIENFRTNTLTGHKFNIRRSKITDRIFWLNTQNGLPLFAYMPLRVYEELYERTLGGKESIGRHFWHGLPSPLPEAVWGDTYCNARQKAVNKHARAVFYEGLQRGVITAMNEKNKCFTILIRADFDAQKYAFDENTSLQVLQDITRQLQALHTIGGPPIIEKRPLYNHPTEALALAFFLRNPLLITAVEAENVKHDAIAERLAALEALQNTREQQKNDIDALILALSGEAIIKQNGQFLYNHTPAEEKWPTLVNVLEQASYPEYALFDTYKALLFDRKQRLQQRAKSLRETFPDGRLMQNLKNLKTTLTARKEALKNEHDPSNGTAYEFYSTALLRVDAHIAALT